MKTLLPIFLLSFCAIPPEIFAESGVNILAENLQQVVTSSTLKWISASKHAANFENAVVGAYQITTDDNVDDNGTPNTIKKPVYVCRARQNSIWIAGHIRPNYSKCVTTLHGTVHHNDPFEILINTEDSARLSWVRRDKYTEDIQGSIAGGDLPFRNFIARRKLQDDGEETTLTHLLGKLDPESNFGIFTFVDQSNKQVEYEDGEILVETEPIRYEMKNIKFSNIKKPQPRDERILGHAVLTNEEYDKTDTEKVVTVISYNFTYKLNWGHGHGLLIGLPFDVYEREKTYGRWGVLAKREIIETYPIEHYLEPGTAVNVTLRGEYVDGEYPYTGTVIAYYKDSEIRDRLIKDNKRESTMINVVPEYGAVYFLHNNSFVPTTTTTTTTTTSTTVRITTTATEALPITPPEVEESIKGKKKEEDLETGRKHPNDNIQADAADASELQEKATKLNQKSSASNHVSSCILSFMAVSVLLLRVT